MRPLPKILYVFLLVVATPSIFWLFCFSVTGIVMFTSGLLTLPIAWMFGADITRAFEHFDSFIEWAIVMAGPIGIYAISQLLLVSWRRIFKPAVDWRKLRFRYVCGALAGTPLLLVMLVTSFFDDYIHSWPSVSGGWLMLPLMITLGIEIAFVRGETRK